MNLRQVNWQNFQLGGSDRTGTIRFQAPKKPDRRDNRAECREANRQAKKMVSNRKNDEHFSTLSEEHQRVILAALEAAR